MRLSILPFGFTMSVTLTMTQSAQRLELATDFGTMLGAHLARRLPAPGKKGMMLMKVRVPCILFPGRAMDHFHQRA